MITSLSPRACDGVGQPTLRKPGGDAIGRSGRASRVVGVAAGLLRRDREARELASLDDRELRDIGVNRYEVAQALGAAARWWRRARSGR